MWNANRHCLCAGSSLQQARRCGQSIPVNIPSTNVYQAVFLLSFSFTFLMSPSRVKKQAEDRPMSMWISSIKQLEPARHVLSPLLLDFMEAAWPSSISMVIPRGIYSKAKTMYFFGSSLVYKLHNVLFRPLVGHTWFGRCC